MNAREVDVAVTETKPCVAPLAVHGINPAALLILVGMSGVKHHSVTGFERAFQLNHNPAAFNAPHFSKIHAPLFAKASMNKFLVVDAAKPARVKAARKAHLQVVAGTGW